MCDHRLIAGAVGEKRHSTVILQQHLLDLTKLSDDCNEGNEPRDAIGRNESRKSSSMWMALLSQRPRFQDGMRCGPLISLLSEWPSFI